MDLQTYPNQDNVIMEKAMDFGAAYDRETGFPSFIKNALEKRAI